jgi:3'-phosphoadenosine 5'-phosphosulfate sulfotransferase (PAPS reductase)/FAD synthetase
MKPLHIPLEIEAAMDAGAAMAVSISGGKDGEAMGNALVPVALARGWHIFALHMDLGRAEWPQTPAHVETIAGRWGIPLVVVSRPQGDLVQEIGDRMDKLTGTGKPFWPSSAARYCTSHQKTNQADKVYRQHEVIISAEGIRSQESPARAKKSPLQLRRQITASALRDLPIEDALAYRSLGQRVAITWFPIFDWSLEDVWQAMGTSTADLERRRQLYRDGREAEALDGWPGHPAYVFGNDRLSCALCVLANDNDIQNGTRHVGQLYRTYRQMELRGGFTFKNGRSLANIAGWGEGLGAFVNRTDWEILSEDIPHLAADLREWVSSGVDVAATLAEEGWADIVVEFALNGVEYLKGESYAY